MHNIKDKRSLTRMDRWIVRGVAVMLVAAVISSVWVAVRSDRQLRRTLVREARLVERGLDPGRVTHLSGNESDLKKEDYWRLKGHLARVRFANDDIRFLYLLGRKQDGSIFVFLDSEPEGSPDYSPPGQTYRVASNPYRHVFDRSAAAVAGPFSDRWGSWISAFVPVFHPSTGEMLAVMGMDIDSRVWRRNVLAIAALPVGLIAALFILATMGLVLVRSQAKLRKNEKSLREALSQIKTLSGFLPICASCKKIRNDEGYWEQLEKYISENTDAVLSHGICPECAERLYPDLYHKLNPPNKG